MAEVDSSGDGCDDLSVSEADPLLDVLARFNREMRPKPLLTLKPLLNTSGFGKDGERGLKAERA